MENLSYLIQSYRVEIEVDEDSGEIVVNVMRKGFNIVECSARAETLEEALELAVHDME